VKYSNSIFYRLLKNRQQLRLVPFLLFAFCILAVSLTFFALSAGQPYMGVTLALDNQGWAVQSIDPNGHADQAGIRKGNRPVEINGQPAPVFLERYEKAGVVFGRLICELTVVDDQGQLKSVTFIESTPSRQSIIEIAMFFIFCLAFWISGFYVFLKKPKNAAAILLCLGSLSFGLALSGTLAAERGISVAPWFEVTAATLGPWLLVHFFLVLPEERTRLRNNWLVYLIYLPAVITLVLFPLIGYADGQPLLAFRSFRLLEYGAGFLAVVGVVVFNFFRAVSPRTRQQMKIVLVSCLAALVPFLILSILPAVIQDVIPSGFNVLFIAFIPLGLGYAVVTQKLMDIDVIIRRGVIYGLITVVMAAILSVAVFFTTAFHNSLGLSGQIFIVLALGAIATALFGPV